MITSKDELSIITPADWVPGPAQGSWTYDDYAALPNDGNRYEIVDGVLIIAPAPSPEHQDIVGMIFHHLLVHIKFAGLGRVFQAPIDVELSAKNIFQPDVVVILNEHLDRIKAKRIVGAPDLVVEVASPSTALYDRFAKYDRYAQTGVQEYWIVNTETKTVQVLVLEHGEYRSLGIFRGEQVLPSRIVLDLPVGVERFFT